MQGFGNQRIGVNISAGSVLAQSGTVVLTNSNGLSFGMQFSASSYVVTASMDAIRSISAGGATAGGSQIVIANGNGLVFGIAGQTITAGNSNVSFFDPPGERNVLLPISSGGATSYTVSAQRISIPYGISVTQIDILRHLTVAGSTAGSFSLWYGIYSITGQGLQSTVSGLTTSLAVTWNSGTNTAAGSIYAGQSGTRFQSLSLNGATWNLTPGEYMFAVAISIAGVAGTTGSMSLFGQSSISIVGEIGGGNATRYAMDGVYLSSGATMQSTVALSGITNSGSQALGQPYFRFIGV